MEMLKYFSQASEVTWVFVVTILCLYLYYWYRRPNNFPPGPRGIPFLGVIPFLGKYPERQIKKWSKTYGPIMSVRMGSKDMIVLNDFQSINQAFVKQQSNFSDRPHVPFFHGITEGYGIIFPGTHDMWKKQRKFGSMTLRGLGFGKRSMESKIIEESSYLNEAIRNENGKPFNISTLLHNAAANNVCSFIFGKRFHYDDRKLEEAMHRILRSFNDPVSNAMNAILIFAPALINVPPFSLHYHRLIAEVGDICKMILEIVKEHENTFDDGDIRDFIDAFIVEMKKEKDSYFSHLQLLHYVRDLFMAGTDTTANLLYWSMLCLIHHPEAQENFRKEVMEVVGRNGVISMSNKADMPYTNAFIEEMFRFRTLLPLGLMRSPTEDAELGGYAIPKGTMVSANLWAAHNDEKVWTEPEKFRPERFLDNKGNFVRSNNVITFSVGPRSCLGEQLARMEVFIFLVGMIQKFEFLPDPSADKLPDIENGSNGMVFVPQYFKLVAKEN